MADATTESSWKELAVGQEEMAIRHHAERQAWFDKLEVVTQSLRAGGTTGDASLDFAILHAGVVLGDLNKTYGGINSAQYHVNELIRQAKEKIGEYCLFDLWDADKRRGSVFCATVPASGMVLDAAQATLTLDCAKHVTLDDSAVVTEIIEGPFTLPRQHILDRVLRHNMFNPKHKPRPTRDSSGCYIGELFGDVDVEDWVFNSSFYCAFDKFDVGLLSSIKLAKALDRDLASVNPIEYRVSRARETCLVYITELTEMVTHFANKGLDFKYDCDKAKRILDNYERLAIELGLVAKDKPSPEIAFEASTQP